jgi:hypothetical protein
MPETIPQMQYRFKSKTRLDPDTGCWIWTASPGADGYGQFRVFGTMNRANRASYLLFKGPIPKGLHVLHNCPCGDNHQCVNPDHLYIGTNNDNVLDKIEKGRQLRGEQIGDSKLTPNDVEIIRHMYSNKHRFSVTQQSLADMFGVCQNQISEIVRQEQWRHL